MGIEAKQPSSLPNMADNAVEDLQNVAAAGLNLSANIVLFVAAAATTVTRGSPFLGLCNDLVKWIARERLSETEFDYCITLIRGLLTPNEDGFQIQKRITLGDVVTKSICGLRLTFAGSIGRMMAWNPEYTYIVTTVAAFTAYHRDEDIVEVLCLMAIGNVQKDTAGIKRIYTPQKARIRPVITKIVESIMHNIVNLGIDFRGFAECLKDYCVHVLSSDVLARVVNTVVHESEQNFLLYSDKLFGDLLVWLFVHYQGTVQVSVEGSIIYEKSLGGSNTKMTYLVRDGCRIEDGHHGGLRDLELSVAIGDSWKSILKEQVPSLKRPESSQRHRFYDLDHINSSFVYGILRRQDLQDIGAAARVVSEWMLDLPLSLRAEGDFGFRATLEGPDNGQESFDPGVVSYSIGQILQTWPSIGHGMPGPTKKVISTFTGFRPSPEEEELVDELKLSIEELILCFPTLQDLFENCQNKCHCSSCRKKGKMGFDKNGCLQNKAWLLFCTLLAHTIAEGFGAPDASGLTDIHALSRLILNLLSDLVVRKTVLWETWFMVATAVHLGCPAHIEKVEETEGATALVATQFGSLTVVGNWVDLTKELRLPGCFGFETAEGQLEGVPQDFAAVQTERQMGPIDNARNNNPRTFTLLHQEGQTPIPPDIQRIFDFSRLDDSEVAFQTAIVGGAGIPYRLLTMVQSGNGIRIVDPSNAIRALTRSLSPVCQHRSEILESIEVPYLKFTRLNIDAVLADWGDQSGPKQRESATISLTSACDSYLKLNVALSTCARFGCVIRRRGCCIPCAILSSQLYARAGFAPRILNVNVATNKLVRRSRGHQP